MADELTTAAYLKFVNLQMAAEAFLWEQGDWPALRDKMAELFRTRSRAEWCELLALERSRQQELIDRESFAEGVRAFVARRKPVFAGR